MRKVKMLICPNGRCPYREWARSLPEPTRAKLDAYVDRVARGGGKRNVKAIGDGVFEVKIDTGPGFRIYFSNVKKTILLLLVGGDKSSQKRDIERAKKYWREYNVSNS